MRLYKFRDLRTPEGLGHLEQILVQQAFWAARPDKLNDPEEFLWSCEYSPTHQTKGLLAEVLHKTKVRSVADALHLAHLAIEQNRLKAYAEPVIQLLQARCRDEIGVVSFSTSGTRDCLWKRYGGDGEGVCVEFEAAPHIVGSQLRPVIYADTKSLHIDQVLQASLDAQAASTVYETALLSKSTSWAEEGEVRFLSREQNRSINLDASPILALTLGRSLARDKESTVLSIARSLPYALEVRYAEA